MFALLRTQSREMSHPMRERCIQTDILVDGQANIQAYRDTDKQYIHKHTDRQTN